MEDIIDIQIECKNARMMTNPGIRFFTGVWGFPQQAKWTKRAVPLWNAKVHFFVRAYALTVLATIIWNSR